MQFTPTTIPDVLTATPVRHQDDRGFFAESFRAEWFPAVRFVQDNYSYSSEAGTVRGLHYQLPPHHQAKLLRVAAGSVRDIAVDLRGDSPTYLHHVAVELTAATGELLFVPGEFAHGFVTLEPHTIVLYKVSNYHRRDAERGIRWDDPGLAIDWGVGTDPILSARDRGFPPFDSALPPFHFGRS